MKLTINKILLVVITLFGVTVLATPVLAQENPEAAAKKYGVSFPVAELGNCNNFSECKAYCDKEENRDACIGFAKKKGFYKEEVKDQGKRADKKLLEAAKGELGCDSETSCRGICEKEENREKCSSFAEKYKLEGPRRGPGDANILKKAKEILGCNSEASCKAVCEKQENQEKCSEFAKQTGLGGGMRRVGPGGCNSEESCRSYCEKNMDECRKLGGGPRESERRAGPSGCNSEESCRAYCEKNPEECRKFGGGPPEGAENRRQGPGGCNSEESCNKYCQEHPQECQGSSGQGPQDMEKFCKENPGRCPNQRGGPGGPNPINPEEFCKQNPDRCRPPEQRRDYSESFRKPPESHYPTPVTRNNGESQPVINIEQTQPSTQTYTAPTIEQPNTQTVNQESAPTTSPERTESSTPQVQGVSTVRSIFDILADWFK